MTEETKKRPRRSSSVASYDEKKLRANQELVAIKAAVPLKKRKKEEEPEYVVEAIVDKRVEGSGRYKDTQYLVRWEGFGEADDTWESIKNLANVLAKVDKFESVLRAKERKEKLQGAKGKKEEAKKQKAAQKEATKKIVKEKKEKVKKMKEAKKSVAKKEPKKSPAKKARTEKPKCKWLPGLRLCCHAPASCQVHALRRWCSRSGGDRRGGRQCAPSDNY